MPNHVTNIINYSGDEKTVRQMLDLGKLAVWRIGTHEQFGGTWLSDYVPNQLGGFTELPSPTEEMEMEP